jgi:hypothetical protein
MAARSSMDEGEDAPTQETKRAAAGPPGIASKTPTAPTGGAPPGLASALIVAKKAPTTTMVIAEAKAGQLIVGSAPARTSTLQAPTMLLTGHEVPHCLLSVRLFAHIE